MQTNTLVLNYPTQQGAVDRLLSISMSSCCMHCIVCSAYYATVLFHTHGTDANVNMSLHNSLTYQKHFKAYALDCLHRTRACAVHQIPSVQPIMTQAGMLKVPKLRGQLTAPLLFSLDHKVYKLVVPANTACPFTASEPHGGQRLKRSGE